MRRVRVVPIAQDAARSARRVPYLRGSPAVRKPVEERFQGGMRCKVVVAQGDVDVDAAVVEACADQERRLVVVADHPLTMPADPRARDLQRRHQVIDLLLVAAPAALLEVRRRAARAA